MKYYILLTLFFQIFSTNILGQNILFKSHEGKLYTESQKDSLIKAGNLVGIQDTTLYSDSTIYSFYFYHRSLLYTDFQKKYSNKPIPRIRMSDLDGNIIDTNELRGKILMINFWATTCSPCIAEMPQLNDLVRDYSAQVIFLGIAPNDKNDVESLLKRFKFDFIIIPNGEQLFEELGIDGYPKNFFVDKAGIIRQVEEGTPVQANKDGTLTKENGEWKILVYQSYSKILDAMIKNE